MFNEELKQCKSKVCNNPVLEGKYCEYCKKKRKERRDKILAGVGGLVILGSCAVKKGAIKQAPKIAGKVIQVTLKK